MKILFDHQIFSLQQYGGVSKYFCELLKRIPRELWDTTTLLSNNEYIKAVNQVKYTSFIPAHYFKGKAALMDMLNRPYSFGKLLSTKYDILHQTDFATYYFSAIKGKKMVVTFHDMNYTNLKEVYKNSVINNITQREILQKKSVERADKIIAVSYNTKKDLINIWNVNPQKIDVIHHGVNKEKNLNLIDDRIISNPYVLYVGERYGFKNFDRFSKAFSLVNKHYPILKLICTGRKFSKEEQDKLCDLSIANNIIQISADENMMAMLYRDAEMFVYPSFSEGFGMPILEAMVYNCPVVLSNSSCFPEVAGSAGVYFDPFQVEDMATKMELLLTSTELRQEKIRLGNSQLNLFSWDKTVQMHLDVYQSLL